MNNNQAVQYLDSLLGKTLRIHATDARMFVGTFKCTDTDRNIILSNTYEYRLPPPPTIEAVNSTRNGKDTDQATSAAKPGTVKMNMISRLIGLVVVPGQYITRIELEETPGQSREREALGK